MYATRFATRLSRWVTVRPVVNGRVVSRRCVAFTGTRTPLAPLTRWYTTEATAEASASAKPDHKEVVSGEAKQHEFKTETQKLLHIVANSLYSEKEVFVRELVSNAADALEKLRYIRMRGDVASEDGEKPLEIHLYADSDARTFTIQDNGIGMTEDELNEHLGTIARSGSKAFIEQLSEGDTSGSSTRDKIIGQFGVGFYSSFMVGNRVRVYTRSAKPGSKGYCWTSDGLGTYSIAEAENVDVGTKIVIELRDNCTEFADKKRIEDIILKYSNFVGFPIYLNGEKVNTVQPLWTMDKNSITEEQHKEFYRFIASAWDAPRFHLHYKTDAPLQINSLLYVPGNHAEKFGMERMAPGVSLYSRKVLIQAKSSALLPEWLRFIKGVVDSEDIPLNLSREMLQDSALITKLRNVMTRRICKWFEEEARRDPEKYDRFFREFGIFFKEGICTDLDYRDDISKLLRFETSATESGKMISLQEYLDRKPESQNAIYYLCTPSREIALESPYYELFKKHNIEVLFLYDSVDEFVMNHLHNFKNVKLISIDSEEAVEAVSNVSDADSDTKYLTDAQAQELADWMLKALGTTVKTVKPSKRLVSHPAVVVDPESPTMRRMMQMISGSNKGIMLPQSPANLEINPNHPIISGLYHIRDERPELAKKLAEQIVDNALIAAGALDDPRTMLPRLNDLLAVMVETQRVPAAQKETTTE